MSDIQKEKLAACPFCGSQVGGVKNADADDGYLLRCSKNECVLRHVFFTGPEWNHRTPSPSLVALIEAAMEALGVAESELRDLYMDHPSRIKIRESRSALAAHSQESPTTKEEK